MSETAVTVIEPKNLFVLPEKGQLKRDLQDINEFQNIVHTNLIPDIDYGTIPGTNKPTLYKPGAEKIIKILHLSDRYEIIKCIEDWDKPMFYYMVKCTLTHEASGEVISEGLGSCNSLEDKYRYRWLWPGEVPAGADKSKMVSRKTKKGGLQYRADNDEIFTIVNTLLKMSKKRAMIDASLSAGRLSNMFTQDVEDIKTALEKEDEDVIEGESEELTDDIGNCPECGKPLTTRTGKYGDFIACTGYPKCQYKPPKEKKTPTKDTDTPEKNAVEASQEENNQTDDKPPTDKDFKAVVIDLLNQLEWSGTKFNKWLQDTYKFSDSRSITVGKRQEIINKLQEMISLK
jgi:uncharacterized Zn finger protein (UPF0148 family)